MKVITFGEIMMRLQPPNCNRILNTNMLEMSFGGGEANVAVCLSNLGMTAEFVTRLPDNDIGKACIGELARWGVDSSYTAIGGERMGVYFCEKGYSQRPSKVIYDRQNSAISTATLDDFDWNRILCDADWFHFTGITAALSDNVRQILTTALVVAKNNGVKISCDLNYRKKLWDRNTAKSVMSKYMQYVDLLIANEEDAKDVFGIEAINSNISGGQLNVEGYKSVVSQIVERFGIASVAITLRESYNANHNGWSALLWENNQFCVSDKYDIQVLDRVGGGDSFVAGLIFAKLNDYSAQNSVNFAVACSCLKHTINGDFNIVSMQEVLNLMHNGGSGRVER